jgi:alanine dehydrogenase
MRIGVPKEVFTDEKRVALTPAGVHQLTEFGHVVYVETTAGKASKFCDDEYRKAGAEIVYTHEEVFQRSEIICKVAPVNNEEAQLLEEGQIIFSFLHLGYSRDEIVKNLVEKKVTAIAYEFIGIGDNFPILHLMSEITGKLAIQIGEKYLGSDIESGRGILMGGFPGVSPAAVVILGAGVVGFTAAKAAIGRGAQVIILDTNIEKLRQIENSFSGSVTTVAANPSTIARGVKFADLIIGAVPITGEKISHIVSEEMVKSMKKGAVIVDVSIDQGGSFETSRPTSISNPIFIKHDVIHYCVPNMPALVSRSSSYGITNTTIEYIKNIADHNLDYILLKNSEITNGIWAHKGFCTNQFLAETYKIDYKKIRIFSTN